MSAPIKSLNDGFRIDTALKEVAVVQVMQIFFPSPLSHQYTGPKRTVDL